MRRLARLGQSPPEGFMAPQAWEVLADFYSGRQRSNGDHHKT